MQTFAMLTLIIQNNFTGKYRKNEIKLTPPFPAEVGIHQRRVEGLQNPSCSSFATSLSSASWGERPARDRATSYLL